MRALLLVVLAACAPSDPREAARREEPIVLLPEPEARNPDWRLEVIAAEWRERDAHSPRWVKLLGLAWHVWDLRLRLVNLGDSPLSFMGYADDAPLTSALFLWPDGWRDQDGDWCGTGAELRLLAPAAAIEFDWSVHGPSGEYLFTVNWAGAPQEERELTVWSAPVLLKP